MGSLTSFFESDFNTQREQWETALKAELKLTEVGNKASKKLITGASWPTLSLETKSEVHLNANENWKKASTTYVHLDQQEIRDVLTEDLGQGVRNFFFAGADLTDAKWQEIEATLKKFPTPAELEVFILDGEYSSSAFKVVSNIISGEEVHNLGGHSVQELALLATNLIKNLNQTSDVYLGVYVDSQFFHNIAKLRAAKLLALKILEEAGRDLKVKIVGLTSYREWTLFERYSNMLRNETAVASAYIGGADHVQSAGYNSILELETSGSVDKEHIERSRRMARNTSHVLALESMLGVVEDAAFGSYHLESLTSALAEESWKLMQTMVGMNVEELKAFIQKETASVREKRLEQVKTRRHVMSGMNDYPDVKEHLKLKLKAPKVFRVARIFEEQRLMMEEVKNKPTVYVALFGEYGALNARLNFVKNYFELLGLTVHDPGHTELDLESFKKGLTERKEDIIVLCALDEQYPNLMEAVKSIKSQDKFIAGKFEMTGFKNLFGGQNVYEVLENLVSRFAGRNV